MAQKAVLFLFFFFILCWSANGLEYKNNAHIDFLSETIPENYFIAPNFAASELCTVRHDTGDDLMKVVHWLYGYELYKSYQDPILSCDKPYPFTVEEVYMVLWFDKLCTLYVSVDVETANLTNPTCPFPGDLLSLSSTHMVIIPDSGLYQVAVPLDSSAVVNEPYFAGFYFAEYVDTLAGAAPVTDNTPRPCVSYNIWDTEIGFVDLYNTGFPSFPQFPGRLLLFSSGTTGGHGEPDPEPSVTILTPYYNEIVVGDVTIWAAETSGSGIIDYMKFDYRSQAGSWVEIGLDSDGDGPLRNGSDPTVPSEGFSMPWDYSGLTEGIYWLRATVYDTLGRASSDSVLVTIDPTPPMPTLVNPLPNDTICLPMVLEITTPDENVSLVKFEKKTSKMNYEMPVVTFNQTPFGSYYCGPVAGAIAIKYWYDQGNIYCMREGSKYLTIDTVVARLGDNMLTDENGGTYDDLFYYGLQQYIVTHGNELRLRSYRNPRYLDYRVLLQERELVLILGLSGSTGVFLVAAGASGLADEQGRYQIKLSDPLTGTKLDTYMRDNSGSAEVYYNDNWQSLDIIITADGYNHTVTREYIGADISAANGWTFAWNSIDLLEDSLYFVTATVSDATGRTAMKTSLSLYGCGFTYEPGDFDNDGAAGISDVVYFINYIYKDGEVPFGGAGRADANCDESIDINDVIFVIKYVLGEGAAPCY
ncbi:MAG: hypothetical protein AB1746_07260 [Candidatus Zixiibacteriota bacterium]